MSKNDQMYTTFGPIYGRDNPKFLLQVIVSVIYFNRLAKFG